VRFTQYKLRRLERDLLQVIVAQKAGIDRSRLSLIENGYVSPRADEVKRLADVLGLSVQQLSGESA
jgi:transcriptional regulator with XRE-family HTH domain